MRQIRLHAHRIRTRHVPVRFGCHKCNRNHRANHESTGSEFHFRARQFHRDYQSSGQYDESWLDDMGIRALCHQYRLGDRPVHRRQQHADLGRHQCHSHRPARLRHSGNWPDRLRQYIGRDEWALPHHFRPPDGELLLPPSLLRSNRHQPDLQPGIRKHD